MAAGLNVIPIGSTSNVYAQQYSQALRNLQVGRTAFLAAVAVIEQAVQAPGGSNADLGTLFGLSEGQADILHDESTSFKAIIEGAGVKPAWDQLLKIMGIMV